MDVSFQAALARFQIDFDPFYIDPLLYPALFYAIFIGEVDEAFVAGMEETLEFQRELASEEIQDNMIAASDRYSRCEKHVIEERHLQHLLLMEQERWLSCPKDDWIQDWAVTFSRV